MAVEYLRSGIHCAAARAESKQSISTRGPARLADVHRAVCASRVDDADDGVAMCVRGGASLAKSPSGDQVPVPTLPVAHHITLHGRAQRHPQTNKHYLLTGPFQPCNTRPHPIPSPLKHTRNCPALPCTSQQPASHHPTHHVHDLTLTLTPADACLHVCLPAC